MEEKERYYSLIDHNGNFTLRDYETGNELTNLYDLDDLLNQQDQRIKELEKQQEDYTNFCSYQFEENKLRYNNLNKELTEQVQELKQRVKELESIAQSEALQHLKLLNYDNVIKNLKQENQELKHQLHDLPKNIVEEFRAGAISSIELAESSLQAKDEVYKLADTILKKYGGYND